MITGEYKSKVDRLCTTFWNHGISNPLVVIEQISYLIFLKRLDELEQRRERQARHPCATAMQPIFGQEQEAYRWSHLAAEVDPERRFQLVSEGAFPFLKGLRGSERSAYGAHMKDAVFMMSSKELLSSAIDQIDALPLGDKDIKGDLYEYMLSKLRLAGQNGQFRTPRHFARLMVRMLGLQTSDTVCDPACGTAGFLVAAAEYVREAFPDQLRRRSTREHFSGPMFSGFDFDSTMLRIASMNLWLHGVEQPRIERRDTLSRTHSPSADQFTVVLANPPFRGSLEQDHVASELQEMVGTRKAELLFVAQIMRILKPGGRAAVIVPDGVLFGSSRAHRVVRGMLVDDHRLDAVISLPAGVFKPYAGVSTAILLWTKTNCGGTDEVFFYEILADGYSLDDRREPVRDNDLSDCLNHFRSRNPERDRDRSAKGFFVSRAEIVDHGYDLSHSRYKALTYEATEHEAPRSLIAQLRALDAAIDSELSALERML